MSYSRKDIKLSQRLNHEREARDHGRAGRREEAP